MRLLKRWLLVFVICGGVVEAQAMPKIRIGTSPTSKVTISPYTRGLFPLPPAVAATSAVSLESMWFVLSNLSDKTIVAVAVTWTITDQSGKQRPYNSRCGGFMTRDMRPVALPRSRLLIGPGMYLPESLAGGGFTGAVPNSALVNELLSASEVSVEVDSVIFHDGEVAGPDNLQYTSEITGRKAAAEAIVGEVAAAVAKGQSPREVLSQLAAIRVPHTDHFARWRTLFAERLLRSTMFDGELAYLKSLPTPPNFYRAVN